MSGFKYAVLWDFSYFPPNFVKHGVGAIRGTNVFSFFYDHESAKECASKLQDVGHGAWVEES